MPGLAPKVRPAPSFVRRAVHGDASSPNMLVCGDNLDVLSRLLVQGERRFRLIYLDPPYNTGRTFKEYKDARAPEEWRSMMKERLSLLAALLDRDGTLVAEIDDTELGTLLVLLDEIMGRENRMSVITIVRSATTGHKAINRGPVNVTDYLLVYAKDRRAFRPHALLKPRAGRDKAYGTVLLNGDQPPAKWRFSPLKRVVADALGYATTREATRALGAEAFEAALEKFCLSEAKRVVRFAQPRYEAISLEARAAVDRSRKRPEAIVVLERPRLRPMILRGGNRLLFLSDKVREVDGKLAFVEPLTNVWSDMPFQGLAREGGVTFSRNKKPERLLARVLELFTDPGDWVLDPFLGSGTTAAVAEKMNRHYVGIERSSQLFDDLCVPRLSRVVNGLDRSGIPNGNADPKGRGFGVYE